LSRKRNIKGISLVELTVAMAILTMVFSGTVTLIIMVVNLSFNTGLKTVAISLAQKGLTDKITDFRANPNPASHIPCTPQTTGLPPGMYSLTKCIEQDPFLPNASPGDFIKITSVASWYPKGDPNLSSYQMTQIIRRSYQ
jgi:type II secretory pathway pseudopilin PulG